MMFIGRLEESTTVEDITEHMKVTGITSINACEEMRTRRLSKAFRVGVAEEEADKMDSEDFWPEGVTFRPYHFQ